MPAKKTAPKAAKSKKVAAPPRPVARKAVPATKPVERAKSASPVRKTVVAPVPAARKSAPLRPPEDPTSTASTESTETIPMRKAAETASVTANGPPVRTEPPESETSTHSASVLSSASDPDDVDSVEAGSLLAGPRNVQPYIVKRGELYMSKEQLEHFRQILTSWKQDLMEEVDRTVSHMKDEAANFPDPNDRATQEEEFSLELRTRDRERKLIRKIDEALKRIEDGSYGYCLETGEEIGIKRLEARPVATLSIEAQERRERRERQYGDRDDRYR